MWGPCGFISKFFIQFILISQARNQGGARGAKSKNGKGSNVFTGKLKPAAL